MRFGTCRNCNKYKYLPTGAECPSCTSDGGKWVVVHAPYGRIGSGRVLYEGLTRDKAKKVARKSNHRLAKKKEAVTD